MDQLYRLCTHLMRQIVTNERCGLVWVGVATPNAFSTYISDHIYGSIVDSEQVAQVILNPTDAGG